MPNTIPEKRQLIQNSTQSVLGEVGGNRNQSVSIPSSQLVQALNRIPMEVDDTSTDELSSLTDTAVNTDVHEAVSALAEQIGLQMINDFNQTPPPVLQQLQSELAQTPTLGFAPQFNPRGALTQRVGRDIMSGISEQGDVDEGEVDAEPETSIGFELGAPQELDGPQLGSNNEGSTDRSPTQSRKQPTKARRRSPATNAQPGQPSAGNEDAMDEPLPPPPMGGAQTTGAVAHDGGTASVGASSARTGIDSTFDKRTNPNGDENEPSSESPTNSAVGKSRTVSINQITRYPEVVKLDARAKKIKTKLQNDIKSGKFEGFMGALVLAIIADILGLFTLGWGGTIIAFIVNLGIYAILASEGAHFKAIAKKNRAAQIIQFVAEYIPFINMAPLWTTSMLIYRYLSNRSISKKVRGIKRLEKTEKKIRRLRLMRMRPPRRLVAALNKELDVINLIAHEV